MQGFHYKHILLFSGLDLSIHRNAQQSSLTPDSFSHTKLQTGCQTDEVPAEITEETEMEQNVFGIIKRNL